MRLFGGPADPNEDARRERDERSLQSIAAGGLPLNAIDRLRENAGKKDFFTSNFSVNELALTRQCGFEPIGQVMGTSVFQIGWNPTAMWSGSGEIAYMSEAHNAARRRAMERLKLEAKMLGAAGVVGVRIEASEFDAVGGMVQFRAIGTAIRKIGDNAPPPVDPFISGLSGQDHWALLKSGFEPTGFVMETCCYYTYATRQTQVAVAGSWRNIELTDFTAAQYAAREIAMEQAAYHAEQQKGDGIVGAIIHNKQQMHAGDDKQPPWIIIEFTFSGTVVKRHGTWSRTDNPEFQVQLS